MKKISIDVNEIGLDLHHDTSLEKQKSELQPLFELKKSLYLVSLMFWGYLLTCLRITASVGYRVFSSPHIKCSSSSQIWLSQG